MLRSLVVVAALAAAALPSALGAQSPRPAPARPLRTLVYAVQYSATTTNEEQNSGLGAGGGAALYGSATTKRTSNVSDSGTLTANVVAASSDGGLVIETSFAGQASAQAAVPVAVYPDGRLGFAAGTPLSPEAARVLPLLARGIVANRDVSPGSSWTVPFAAPVKGAYVYRVTALDGDVATFAIDLDMTVPGAQGFDEHGKATAQYDTKNLCPTRLDYTGVARHQPSMGQYVSTNAHLTATLVSDSFAKR